MQNTAFGPTPRIHNVMSLQGGCDVLSMARQATMLMILNE